jgi:hypothetical protein
VLKLHDERLVPGPGPVQLVLCIFYLHSVWRILRRRHRKRRLCVSLRPVLWGGLLLSVRGGRGGVYEQHVADGVRG